MVRSMISGQGYRDAEETYDPLDTLRTEVRHILAAFIHIYV